MLNTIKIINPRYMLSRIICISQDISFKKNYFATGNFPLINDKKNDKTVQYQDTILSSLYKLHSLLT